MKIIKQFDADTLVKQLVGETTLAGVESKRASQLRALSQCITWVENDPFAAQILLQHNLLVSMPNHSRVIGITGLPGAGKSTLTDGLISAVRKKNLSIAILAVDPSSQKSGGALLGDRVRMQSHFADPNVYIRSMGTRGTLGGVARATRTAIRLLGFMGFDLVLVETVGVGQSESDILQIADTTVLVLMPQSGDEIQLMKAGLLENADIYVVNKSDLHDPSRMMVEIEDNTAHVAADAWKPIVLRTAAAKNEGLNELLNAIENHETYLRTHPALFLERLQAAVRSEVQFLLEPYIEKEIEQISALQLTALKQGQTTPIALAQQLLKTFLKGSKS